MAMKASDQPERFDRAVRAICRERCAYYGEQPCYAFDHEPWPNEECELDCRALVEAVVQAWNKLSSPPFHAVGRKP